MKSRKGRRPTTSNVKTGHQRNHQFSKVSKKPSIHNLPEGVFTVDGLAAVREYLRYQPAAVLKVFVKEASAKHVRQALQMFNADLVVVDSDVDEPAQATPVWAHVRHELGDWTDFLAKIETQDAAQSNTVLVLDHISDPRNLGAIVRSAAFFGVRHVIVPERRQVLLTQASVNTAQGGFALTQLVVVVNVSRALEELKTKGYWVLGAAMSGQALSSVRGRYERQVLVLGSEDKGISPGVLSRCDVLVSITGAEKSLDSLNVSVAAGILIHELRPV